MATTNRERVGRAFELLASGLGPFVERQMKATAGQGLLPGPHGPGDEGSPQDPAFLLRVMADAWDSAFRQHLTKPGSTDQGRPTLQEPLKEVARGFGAQREACP